MNTFIEKKRLMVFVGLLLLFTALLLLKYAKQMLLEKPAPQNTAPKYERGQIVDRNGKILATATTLYNLSLNKIMADNLTLLVEVLAPILDISENELFHTIQKTDSHFLYLKKKLSESEKNLLKAVIEDQKLKGLRFEPISNRTYPENNLASTIIGYLGDDGRGLAGVEYSMQNILMPPQGKAGYTVFLTIDSTMQYLLQQIAEKTKRNTQAEAVIFLAVDAKTGEILAYVNEPSADLAHYPSSTPQERFDRPAYFMYEPGSVFKIFSLASFLDIGAVRDSDTFHCDAQFLFMPRSSSYGEKNSIRCLRSHGMVSPREIIRFSCNDGMAQIADRANSTAFAEKLKAFGFGNKTGIELPGEAAGLFAPVTQWSGRTKHTISIGQEIAVTSLQIMQAATAFTNQGKTVKLSILSEIHDENGVSVYRHKRNPIQQVVSAKTARLILDYMQTAADEGTGTRASINGVSIAVKTGTAQMAAAGGKGYSSTDYLSSCIGIFPVEDPKIILYTAIIRPVGETYGSLVAAPIISEAANAIIDYRGMGRTNAPNVSHSGIIKTYPKTPITITTTMPNLIGTSKRQLLDLLIRKDLSVRLIGDGYVVKQIPPAGTPITKGMLIELTLD